MLASYRYLPLHHPCLKLRGFSLHNSHSSYLSLSLSSVPLQSSVFATRLLFYPHSFASISRVLQQRSNPNPKRAQRHPHYHSCSRQRKVCLDTNPRPLFTHFTFSVSYLVVILYVYVFQALCKLISGRFNTWSNTCMS